MYRSLPAGLETVRYLVQEEQRTSEGSINRFFHRQERTEDRHNDRRVSMIDVRERELFLPKWKMEFSRLM